MEKTSVIIAIIGGIGLGLMLGSEFSGGIITFIGAILMIICIISIGLFSYLGRKK